MLYRSCENVTANQRDTLVVGVLKHHGGQAWPLKLSLLRAKKYCYEFQKRLQPPRPSRPQVCSYIQLARWVARLVGWFQWQVQWAQEDQPHWGTWSYGWRLWEMWQQALYEGMQVHRHLQLVQEGWAQGITVWGRREVRPRLPWRVWMG